MSNIWIGYSQEGLAIKQTDLKFYDVTKPPISLHGLPTERYGFRRLPDALCEAVPSVKKHAETAAGVRARFATDSPYLAIRLTHRDYGLGGPCTSKTAACGVAVYYEQDGKDVFGGLYTVPRDRQEGYEGELRLPEGRKEITLCLPTYTEVFSMEIGIREGCLLEAHRPYRIETPVVFYGSSITQGGSAGHPGTIYENFISRNLDCDYYNLGFSGNCKGEPEIARYIAGLSMSAFVLDYDHNAPTVDHLAKTHEPFFRIIREAQPELPIVLVSRPGYNLCEEMQARRAVIAQTFVNARAAGDQNVYFVNGYQMFPEACRDDCTLDGCHPNDLGMYYMAQSIGGVLKEILSSMKVDTGEE